MYHPTTSSSQYSSLSTEPSNQPQYSRYCSRSNSNSYRRSSRDTRYKSRSSSLSHSRPRYNDKPYPHNYSSYYDRNRSRIHKSYFFLHLQIIFLPLLVVHLNIVLILVNAHLIIITPNLNDTPLLTTLRLNHVMTATVVDHIQTQKTTPIFKINPLLI